MDTQQTELTLPVDPCWVHWKVCINTCVAPNSESTEASDPEQGADWGQYTERHDFVANDMDNADP